VPSEARETILMRTTRSHEECAMTTTTVQPTPDRARLGAASALQKLLPELVALSLDAKQAHWNMTGRAFLPLHAFTDVLAADARSWADRVAERAVVLGFAVDARPGTVAAVAGNFPAGRLGDRDVVIGLGTLIDNASTTARGALEQLSVADPVAHDLAVAILEGLEKHGWMLRAHLI
jgi:starvation-inducible DNA-binding protein